MSKDNRDKCPHECGCAEYKRTPRSGETVKNLETRINRVIGQLGGIKAMLRENRYCNDILTQLSAAESALSSIGYIILREHIETCVAEKLAEGDTEIIDETIDIMKKLK